MLHLASNPAIWDNLQGKIRHPPTVEGTVDRLLELYRDRSFQVLS
jgi:hypothetical protein